MQVDDANASLSSIAFASFETNAIVERPDHLRVDLYVSRQRAATITSDGTTLVSTDLRRGQQVHVPATAAGVQSIIGVTAPPHVIVSLALGRAPVLVHTEAPQIRWEGGRYLVTIASRNDWRETIAVVPRPEDWDKPWSSQRLRLLGVRVEKTDGVLYDATLADHALAAMGQPASPAQTKLDEVLGVSSTTAPSGPPCTDTEIPMTVEIASGGRSVSLHEKKVVINPPIQPGVFTQ